MSDLTSDTETAADSEPMPRMGHGAVLDIKAYTGPTKVCPECDNQADDETNLIILEVSGTNGNNTQFMLCSECLVASLELVSNGDSDSVSVSTPA